MSSFSHCRDLITRLDWLQLEVAFFQQNEKSLHYDVFQSNLMHEYILKIREKTIITIFHCGMLVIFWECYWSFEFLIKVVPSYRIVFRKCMCFQIFLDYAKYFTRRFGSLVFCIAVGRDGKDSLPSEYSFSLNHYHYHSDHYY